MQQCHNEAYLLGLSIHKEELDIYLGLVFSSPLGRIHWWVALFGECFIWFPSLSLGFGSARGFLLCLSCRRFVVGLFLITRSVFCFFSVPCGGMRYIYNHWPKFLPLDLLAFCFLFIAILIN
jgi:hypothetical protein